MHFSLLSGQEYTAPGLFIANLVDNQPDTMPIAAGRRRCRASRRRPHRPITAKRILDQGVGTVGRYVHGDERAEQLYQDLPTGGEERDKLN